MQCTNKILAIIPGKFGDPPGSLFVPCGKCLMCRVARSREWGLRCLHEMQYHEESVFATLTYNPTFLPWKMDLQKKELQNYIKRLRKSLEPRKIRYLASGEYGDINNIPDGTDERPQDPDYWTYYARGFGRPHYHLIIFGVSLHEHKLTLLHTGKPENGYKCTGGPIYDAWTDPITHYSKGFIVLGAVTYNSARYCVEYIFKQVDKINARIKYRDLQQPFKLQSQGLGGQYAIENQDQLCYNYTTTLQGHELGLPRYYQKKIINTPERREEFHEKARKANEARRDIWRRKGVPEEEIERHIQEARIQKQRDVSHRIHDKEIQNRRKIKP
jgi:hypothetical protein